MKRALVVWGGLEVHEPEAGAHFVRRLLETEDFDVVVSNDYAALGGRDIASFDLVVPQVTGGEIEEAAVLRLADAIRAGTGIGGFHHALVASFRGSFHFRFIASATLAGHPGGIIPYRVDVTRPHDPIMAEIASFEHRSEQYYLHVDPAIEVLATTTFSGEHATWRTDVEMPVVFKTSYGKGRVFYSSLGHKPQELERSEIHTILKRGLLWAAR